MRRLVLQGTAIVLGGTSVLLAWAWSEARPSFVVLGLATVLGLMRFARRFPEPGRWQLIVAAVTTFAGSVALAGLLPSTRVLCDCPLPANAVRACACAVDHHLPLRLAAVAGAVMSGVLVLWSRRRSHVPPQVLGSAR
jgi:hypothetical protein